MYKVIKETAYQGAGYCCVVIQSKEGKFTGYSFCNPEDDFSSFAGIKYAEKRAVAALCKEKAKIAKNQLQAVQNLKKDLNFKYKNPDKDFLRILNLKIRDYDNAVNHWNKVASDLQESILLDDKERASILSKYSHTD